MDREHDRAFVGICTDLSSLFFSNMMIIIPNMQDRSNEVPATKKPTSRSGVTDIIQPPTTPKLRKRKSILSTNALKKYPVDVTIPDMITRVRQLKRLKARLTKGPDI